MQRVGNRVVYGQLVRMNDQLANSSSWWDLSTWVDSSRHWTCTPHDSMLPSRGPRKKVDSHRRSAEMLTGCEEDLNSQQEGSEEETKVSGRNEVSCSDTSQNIRPSCGQDFYSTARPTFDVFQVCLS